MSDFGSKEGWVKNMGKKVARLVLLRRWQVVFEHVCVKTWLHLRLLTNNFVFLLNFVFVLLYC